MKFLRIRGRRFADGSGDARSALKLIGDENSSIVGIARTERAFSAGTTGEGGGRIRTGAIGSPL